MYYRRLKRGGHARKREFLVVSYVPQKIDMAVGGGIEPPAFQNAEIRKPASVWHFLAVLGSRQ
jgi:hypothetical protein